MNKRKKVAIAKHRAKARKDEVKRRELRAAPPVVGARPAVLPRPASSVTPRPTAAVTPPPAAPPPEQPEAGPPEESEASPS